MGAMSGFGAAAGSAAGSGASGAAAAGTTTATAATTTAATTTATAATTTAATTTATAAATTATATTATTAATTSALTAGLNAATVAAASSVASQASISAINNQGRLGKVAKDITSKEALKNTAIAAVGAGIAGGALAAINPAPVTSNTSLATNLKTSFTEVATQTVASTAAQGAINGDSLSEALKNQGKNILIYTVAKVGANQIGAAYHPADGSAGIGKPLQLTLHAGLGAATAAATGNDAASGAIAGVAGELAAEGINKAGANIPTSIQVANLTGAISSVAYGGLTGQSDEEMANNAWEGSRIGQNAAQNNFATTIVGGAVGATGAVAGAYMEGERDPKKLAIAGLVGGTIGAASGTLFQPEGVIAGIRTGAAVGMIGGGFEGAATTKLTNPNATFNDVANGFAKGSISGGIGGAVGGGFGGAIGATGASGYAAESVAAMMGLGAGVSSSAITTNYNFFNTQNQTQYIDYTPRNLARTNTPTWFLSPNFSTQSNYLIKPH